MNEPAVNHPANAGRIVPVERIIDAPRALVFQAWIEPVHILRWYRGSSDWTTPYAESDPRPAGKFRIGFGSPDGKNDFAFEGIYTEVTASERLAFTIADGRPVTVHFADVGGKTRVTVDLALETTYSEDQQREGWGMMLMHLDQYLAEYLRGQPRK